MQTIETFIDQLHIEDLQNRLHPSMFDENDRYDILIVRLPVIKKELESVSLGFIFTSDKSYQYNVSTNNLEELENRFESPHAIIDTSLDNLLKSFTQYQEQISDMEESLYTDSLEADFMTQWLGLKRDILRIERIMIRTSSELQTMINYYEKYDDFPLNHYVDIHEHSERVVRSASLQLSKLDYLYSFYNARTNEKMNRLIFILTIISAIFLPLNLVVGFFGMNTSGLPFTGGSSGTSNVIIGLSLLMIITSLGVLLWRKRVEHSE